MRKFRISSKSIFLTLIVLVIFIGCQAEESRSENSLRTIGKLNDKPGETFILRRKRTVKFEDLPLTVRKRLLENLDTISDYEEDAEDENFHDDLEDETIVKREAILENIESDRLHNNQVKRDDKEDENLELGKLELEKIEREILDLKEHSKIPARDNSKRQTDNSIHSLSSTRPRLLKIEVGAFEMSPETSKKKSDRNIENNKPKKEIVLKDEVVQRREISNLIDDNTRNHETEIEKKIQRKIDLLNEKVKRELEEEKRIKEIEINNAKFDQVQAMVAEEMKDMFSPDVKRKRSIYEDNDETPRKKRKAKLKKYRKSILIPERAYAKVEDELPADLELDPKLGISMANKFSRRSKHNGDHVEKNIRATNTRSFLFPGKIQQEQGMSSDHKRLTKSSKNRSRHKHKRRDQRVERAADEPLDDVKSDSVAESDRLVDVANSQDIGPQLSPEYQEAFGGLPSDTGAALGRYKRIKRDKF